MAWSASTLLWQGCVASKAAPEPSPRVVTAELISALVPDVVFPAFPYINATYDEATGLVSMPLDDLERIYEYKLRVEEARDTLAALRQQNAAP